jgi:hypothetical protein
MTPSPFCPSSSAFTLMLRLKSRVARHRQRWNVGTADMA